MITLISAIISAIYGFAIVKKQGEAKEAVQRKRAATKTNSTMQERITIAFENKYKKLLSIVDATVIDICDYLMLLFINAGLKLPNIDKKDVVAQLEWETVTIGSYKTLEEYYNYSRSNLTLYDRLTQIDCIKNIYEYLIRQETKRAMWKRGYKYAYGGKDSDWQEAEKLVKKTADEKAEYPWMF